MQRLQHSFKHIFIYGKFLERKIMLRAAGNIYKSQLLSANAVFFFQHSDLHCIKNFEPRCSSRTAFWKLFY